MLLSPLPNLQLRRQRQKAAGQRFRKRRKKRQRRRKAYISLQTLKVLPALALGHPNQLVQQEEDLQTSSMLQRFRFRVL